MTKLEYHKDKNLLMDWLMLNSMTTGEIALWHTLMNVGNRLGNKTVFNVPTSTLMKYTGLSKQGLMNAREKLLDRGFIDFQKGRKNQAPVYEMFPLHQVVDSYLPFKQPTKLTHDLTHDLTIHQVSLLKSSSRGETREVHPLFKIYEENLNEVTPMIEEELGRWVNIFNEQMVERAIRQTVKRGGKTFSYLEKIFIAWNQKGLKTLEDVETYEKQQELEKTKKLIPLHRHREPKESLFTELLKEEF